MAHAAAPPLFWDLTRLNKPLGILTQTDLSGGIVVLLRYFLFKSIKQGAGDLC